MGGPVPQLDQDARRFCLKTIVKDSYCLPVEWMTRMSDDNRLTLNSPQICIPTINMLRVRLCRVDLVNP